MIPIWALQGRRSSAWGACNPDALERQLAHQGANAVRRALYAQSGILARARYNSAGVDHYHQRDNSLN